MFYLEHIFGVVWCFVVQTCKSGQFALPILTWCQVCVVFKRGVERRLGVESGVHGNRQDADSRLGRVSEDFLRCFHTVAIDVVEEIAAGLLINNL